LHNLSIAHSNCERDNSIVYVTVSHCFKRGFDEF
jgi:hypothetical protein